MMPGIGRDACCLLPLALPLLGCGAEPSVPDGQPNIVLLVADDLGWNDVGYHGSECVTPNIDRLAAEGVQLDRFTTMAICSPTRMGLLTGRYPIRWGLMSTVIRPWDTAGLPPEEETLAEMLAELGYARRALVGKWHVGHGSRDQHPLSQGFTEFYGHYNGAVDYFDHSREGEVDWHRGFEDVDEPGQYTTNLITDEAVRFIDEGAADSPYFLFVSFNAPHYPLQAPAEYLEQAQGIEGESRRRFAAMVRCMDDGIGRILEAVDRTERAENTLVWFLSDNGGDEHYGADNAPLRGEKPSVFDGGIRVPAAVRWPAGGLEGGRPIFGDTSYIDVFPTLRAAASAGDSVESRARTLDGVNLLPYLQDRAACPQRDLFAFTSLNKGPASGGEALSVTTAEWKLLRFGPSPSKDPTGASASLALFRIREDPGETQDLAASRPRVVLDLLERLRAFRALQPANPPPRSSATAPTGWRAPPRWRIPH